MRPQNLFDTNLTTSQLYKACGLPPFESFECKNGKIVGMNPELSSWLTCNFTLINHEVDKTFGQFGPR
jgi:hypothetical protein